MTCSRDLNERFHKTYDMVSENKHFESWYEAGVHEVWHLVTYIILIL